MVAIYKKIKTQLHNNDLANYFLFKKSFFKSRISWYKGSKDRGLR